MPVRATTSELFLEPRDDAEDEDAAAPTADLVRRARGGDSDAFALLLMRHERMVLRTASRLLDRSDLAQDAAQETFLRLFKYLGRFDETRELGPWLYRMTVNVCHDLERKARTRSWVTLEAIRERATTRGGPEDIEGAVVLGEKRRLVQEALRTLPRKERAAIVLRDLEGLPTATVARILRSSEGTVRSQVSTARLKIKRVIEARRETRG